MRIKLLVVPGTPDAACVYFTPIVLCDFFTMDPSRPTIVTIQCQFCSPYMLLMTKLICILKTFLIIRPGHTESVAEHDNRVAF